MAGAAAASVSAVPAASGTRAVVWARVVPVAARDGARLGLGPSTLLLGGTGALAARQLADEAGDHRPDDDDVEAEAPARTSWSHSQYASESFWLSGHGSPSMVRAKSEVEPFSTPRAPWELPPHRDASENRARLSSPVGDAPRATRFVTTHTGDATLDEAFLARSRSLVVDRPGRRRGSRPGRAPRPL